MANLLYLDTARLGRMSPSARRAHADFVAMASEEGASLYFDHFLHSGSREGCRDAPSRYPGLAAWNGIASLKRNLRTLAGSSSDLPVLLANRSAQLMKLAGRLLFHRCENVLATDLGWPGYHEILASECLRANRAITTIPVRDLILKRRIGEDELVAYLAGEFARHHCDGLFLTAVNNLGVRLPIDRIVSTLEEAHQVWFVVVDGAQDYCHVAEGFRNGCCDLYLAGVHKWLGAYHPMGLAFYGRRRFQGFIETVLGRMTECGDLDDPMLRFANRLESGKLDGLSETVALAPLFACQGAAMDAGNADRSIRFGNLMSVASMAEGSGWHPLLPESCFRSGILLLQAERSAKRESDPAAIRAEFYAQAVALTAYEEGRIRLSMPQTPLQRNELQVLRQALLATA